MGMSCIPRSMMSFEPRGKPGMSFPSQVIINNGEVAHSVASQWDMVVEIGIFHSMNKHSLQLVTQSPSHC